MNEVKKCTNCRFRATDYKEEPCCSCQCCSKWEPEEEKKCRTCKFDGYDSTERPCRHCRGYSEWQSKDSKIKAGDLVVSKNDEDPTKTIYIYLRNNRALSIPNYVIVRSKCDYCFSDYIDKLIANPTISFFWINEYDLEFASSSDMAKHDYRAKAYYITDTLNKWFSGLIGETEKKDFKTLCKECFSSEIKVPQVFTTPNMIKDVIFSDPATIIFWNDGTKTVVKTQDGEKYDKEKGFAMAVCKKVFGNERDYYHVFKRWMRKGKEFKDHHSILNDIYESIANITPIDDTKPKGEE